MWVQRTIHVFNGVQIPTERGIFEGDMCRPMVNYHAKVTAQRTRQTNAFTAAMGDVTKRRCGLLPNYFGHLFLFSCGFYRTYFKLGHVLQTSKENFWVLIEADRLYSPDVLSVATLLNADICVI